MIHLVRTQEPEILKSKKDKWLQTFIESGKKRPPNSQYAHNEIKDGLYGISHRKCFYCERLLKGVNEEVDHQIEVSIDRTKSFVWENLYLCCDNCNGKKNHIEIPINEALDPFVNTDDEIESNITFENEIVRMKDNSEFGEKTITKYKLDSMGLDFVRSQFITKFYEEYTNLLEKTKQEGNREFTQEEIDSIRKYSYRDHPFSLMFKVLLRKKGLI